MGRMPVSLTAPAPFAKLDAPLRAVVRAVLAREERRAGEIAIVLAGDAELRELNRAWRGIDRATDVISFAYDEDEPDAGTRPVGGDLVISMERVAEQAKRYRVTPGAELARLVVHGTLHLCGHDHVGAGERTVMREREAGAVRAVRAMAKRLDAAWSRPRRAAKPKRAPASARRAGPKRTATSRRTAVAPAAKRSSATKRTAKKRAAPARARSGRRGPHGSA